MMLKSIIGMFLLFAAIATVQAAGDADAGKQKSMVCAGCHGLDGNSPLPNYPNLAGQGAQYLAKQLRDFKSGTRTNAIMQGQVAALSDQDMDNLAAYFSTQKVKLGSVSEDHLQLGQTLYRGGDPNKGIAACASCHGPTGAGNSPAKFPALSGQHAEYSVAQLQAFKAKSRSNDPAGMMQNTAGAMDEDEIQAVAHYLEGLH